MTSCCRRTARTESGGTRPLPRLRRELGRELDRPARSLIAVCGATASSSRLSSADAPSGARREDRRVRRERLPGESLLADAAAVAAASAATAAALAASAAAAAAVASAFAASASAATACASAALTAASLAARRALRAQSPSAAIAEAKRAASSARAAAASA